MRPFTSMFAAFSPSHNTMSSFLPPPVFGTLTDYIPSGMLLNFPALRLQYWPLNRGLQEIFVRREYTKRATLKVRADVEPPPPSKPSTPNPKQQILNSKPCIGRLAKATFSTSAPTLDSSPSLLTRRCRVNSIQTLNPEPKTQNTKP